jgi:hypothetical protein
MKALITILRKLYLQAGAGRQIGALKRGISHKGVLESIADIIRILESESIIAVTSDAIHPIRRQTQRVHQILNAPNLSTDPIVEKVKQL